MPGLGCGHNEPPRPREILRPPPNRHAAAIASRAPAASRSRYLAGESEAKLERHVWINVDEVRRVPGYLDGVVIDVHGQAARHIELRCSLRLPVQLRCR